MSFPGIPSLDAAVMAFIQTHFHNTVTDTVFPIITSLGEAGIGWIVLSLVLLCFKKTRRTGGLVLIAMTVTLLFGELTLKNIIDIAHSMKKQCIAVGIDREETYQKAVKLGVDALEGPYVAEKLTTQTHSSGYLQSNFFRLMVAMTRDEPDVEEIEQIISVDATLTYGLLRMANSCYYALRHRVTSVRQAIMTMGLSELRQWVYLLSASNAENQMEEGAEEFLRMSFMREIGRASCRERV